MDDKLTFDELYEAYILCLKNKKKKAGTYNFVNEDLCSNLLALLDELNNRTYKPKASDCYVITDPALREIYAAQFSDRIVQHFYMKEIDGIICDSLVDGCCSCIKSKGTGYALKLLKKYLIEVSNNGKNDCYFLKIDLSGYFMSIDRKQISEKFKNLILNKYNGKHKELLLYLTPIIFENNPAHNCKYKCSEKMRNKVPTRRKMDVNSPYGMAIGNLTAQAASNVNLNDFDHYVVYDLGFSRYVRYVDDIVIVSNCKEELIKCLPLIIKKLVTTNQVLSPRKTKIDTAYHGINFLGKVSYPYGYQKPNKRTIIRVCQKAKTIIFDGKENLLAKTNSQIGSLKNYNCSKLIKNYAKLLPDEIKKIIFFNKEDNKFNILIPPN